MLDFVTPFKRIAKVERLTIDNYVFRLHRLTAIGLAVFSLIVTSKQYIGDPIDCIVDEIPPNVMDTYCWIYSTFTVPEKLKGKVGKDMAHKGVGNYIHEEDEIKYHKYYQWVCFVLLFQSVLFYIPRYFWKSWENGRIKSLILNLNEPVLTPECKKDRKEALSRYFQHNVGSHDSYFYKFLICEIANFINVLGQMFFLDFFLDGEFWSYGALLYQFNHDMLKDDEDPMARVFPKVTKCTFHKYGPSGSVQTFDGLCVLPVNILNEKLFGIIWFWFVILIIVSGLTLMYRVLYMIFGFLRPLSLFMYDKEGRKAVKNISEKFGYGDWFIMGQLQKNMDSNVFKEVLEEIHVAQLESIKNK